MIIAGGTYIEECVAPRLEALLGSGGRAALALRALIPIEFHTFYPDPEEIFANFGANTVIYPSDAPIRFRYLHPLARPQISPFPPPRVRTERVSGDQVLLFGCLEGEFVIDAEQSVYDPQGCGLPFRQNGSVAKRLAVILNATEARELAHHDDINIAGKIILASEAAEVIIIKHGPTGAFLFSQDSDAELIPAFRTSAVNKIGSGDIFSAMFSYYWCKLGYDPVEAATLASRQVADYAQTRILARPSEPPIFEEVSGNPERMSVLVAADRDTTTARWLVEEARLALQDLGVGDVLIPEPYMTGTITDWVAQSDVVLALPTTINGQALSIVHAACRQGVPCVAFAETPDIVDTLSNTKALIVGDFAASLYSVIWA